MCTDTNIDQMHYVGSSFVFGIYFFHIYVEYVHHIHSSTLSNFISLCVLSKEMFSFCRVFSIVVI